MGHGSTFPPRMHSFVLQFMHISLLVLTPIIDNLLKTPRIVPIGQKDLQKPHLGKSIPIINAEIKKTERKIKVILDEEKSPEICSHKTIKKNNTNGIQPYLTIRFFLVFLIEFPTSLAS